MTNTFSDQTVTEKRGFYGKGAAKGFTKKSFFEATLALANGEEVSNDLVALVAAAAEYELEGITLRTSTTGEKKDPLESPYYVTLRNLIVPMLTKEPLSSKEYVDKLTAKGSLAPSGKPWTAAAVGRIFRALAKEGKVVIQPIVKQTKSTTKSGQEITVPKEVDAYKIA